MPDVPPINPRRFPRKLWATLRLDAGAPGRQSASCAQSEYRGEHRRIQSPTANYL